MTETKHCVSLFFVKKLLKEKVVLKIGDGKVTQQKRHGLKFG